MPSFVANTNVVEMTGLRDEITEAWINDAVVTVTVIDSTGDDAAGQSWPTTMDYVADSDGTYRAFLSADLELLNKKKYRAVIDADGGSDRVGHWEVPFTPITRTTS